jgi:hypothetical protein
MNRYQNENGNNFRMSDLRDRRRVEGKERQEHRNSMTDEQQLIRLDSRPGKSLKERVRLKARINAKKNQVIKPENEGENKGPGNLKGKK